jgi:nucleoside-diphosphate-sugar epimerase
MKTLVTGGAGFIGSHLVEALLREGYKVRILDSFRSGKRENLAGVLDRIDLIEGDVRDLDACRHACEGVERVWHLAGMASVPESVADPEAAYAINVTGTINMLSAASKAGAHRLVFASSCAVYGDNPQLPCRETHIPAPTSPYAATKLEAETLVREYAGSNGLKTVALRFFNVYGPRQSPESDYASVVPRFLVALMEERQPTIFGDGEQSRDFVYVADIAQANILAGLNDANGIDGEHFNVAAGHSLTVNNLLQAAQQALGATTDAVYLPERAGDIKHSSASIDKAVAKLRYQPKWSLQDGIAETAKWFVESRS